MDMSENEREEYDRAVFDIQRIKNGGFAELSVAQITFLNTNMSDAYQNLPEDQFYQVYCLFQELLTDKTKVKMDFEGYLDATVKIIKRFDKIAPYEKYCGQDEFEMSLLMEDIRSEERNESESDNNLSDALFEGKIAAFDPITKQLAMEIHNVILQDIHVYKDGLRKHIVELFISPQINEKLFLEIRNTYLDKVREDALNLMSSKSEYFAERIKAVKNYPQLCGYDFVDMSSGRMAGAVFAMCYWAIANKEAVPDCCIIMNHDQDDAMQCALGELQNEYQG